MNGMDPNRRELLRLAAAGATGALLSNASSAFAAGLASQESGERELKKCCKFGMVKTEGSILEKFQLLKDVGFDGVELDSPSELDPDEVLAARDTTGLAVPGVIDSVHWTSTLGDADPEVRAKGRLGLEKAIADCKLYGGDTVLLVPAVVNKNVSYEDAWQRSRKEILHVLPAAERAQVRIAFENVWNHFLLSPREAAEYVDSFESEWVGWYLDIGNIVNFGWPEHWVQTLGHRILRLDIKEFSRAKRDGEGLWKGFDVKIGDGDCDWPSVMTALDGIGYSGWASAEVPGGSEERLREIAQRMDRIFGE